MDKVEIRGSALNWFSTYFENRTQRVTLGRVCLTQPGIFKHGIPQGSVLEPILFFLCIHNLCDGNFLGGLILFADDTALCFRGINRQLLRSKIEADLRCITWWLCVNKIV